MITYSGVNLWCPYDGNHNYDGNYVEFGDNYNDYYDVGDIGNNVVKKIERPHCQTYHEVKSKIMATIIMMATMLTLVIITMIIMMLAMLAIMLSKFERSHCQTYP